MISTSQLMQALVTPINESSSTTWPAVSAIAACVFAIGTIVAGVAAIFAVRAWRTQLRGRANHFAARRLQRAIYRYRDYLLFELRGFVRSEECLSRPGHVVGQQLNAADIDYAINLRIDRAMPYRRKLQGQLREAEILRLADGLQQRFWKMYECEIELIGAKNVIVEWMQQKEHNPSYKHPRPAADVIFRPLSQGDPFAERLYAAAARMARCVQRHITSEGLPGFRCRLRRWLRLFESIRGERHNEM